LNNRLAAIGALADLLHGSPLDPERSRALMMLHGEVRRAAEITQHFLELAQHPIGAAEPSDCSIVLNGVLAEREGTLKELGVKLFRFTQSAGGGEIEFALARALAQSSGGTLRLRPRAGGGAEVVVTLPKSVLAPLARATAATPSLPKLRILVVDDDAVNRQAM